MENLYIVMPAYNEEENIETVVTVWYQLLKEKGDASRLVVADSGSTDNTHNILMEMQKQYPKLEILSETGKQHGPKLIALYDYAIKNNADFIFQTDSDGQTNPEEFGEFWVKRNEYDAILGRRRSRGDGYSRKCIESFLCMILHFYFKVNVLDSNAPFRLMKAKLVEGYLPRFSADYNLPNVMLTTFFSYYGEKIEYVDISFKPRQGGSNSINIRKIVHIGFDALSDFKAFQRTMN